MNTILTQVTDAVKSMDEAYTVMRAASNEIRQLREENALLRARLRLVDAKLYKVREELPSLLIPQAE